MWFRIFSVNQNGSVFTTQARSINHHQNRILNRDFGGQSTKILYHRMSRISRLPNLDSRSNYKNYKLLLKLIDKVFLGTYLTDQFMDQFYESFKRFVLCVRKNVLAVFQYEIVQKKNPSFRRVLKCIIFQYAKQGRKIKGPTPIVECGELYTKFFLGQENSTPKKSGYYTREFYTIFSFFLRKILLVFLVQNSPGVKILFREFYTRKFLHQNLIR